MERRYISPEVRAESGSRFISGHAAVFNSPTNVGGMFLEQIKRGAFSRAIRQKQDTRALFNHDPSQILGRVSNGTLDLDEDDRGLHFRCEVARTSTGDDVLSLIRRGDLREMSFGFRVVSGGEQWTRTSEGKDLRNVTDCDLEDVSPVCFPAYDGTDVAARGLVSMLSNAPIAAPIELRSRIERQIQVSEEEEISRMMLRLRAAMID